MSSLSQRSRRGLSRGDSSTSDVSDPSTSTPSSSGSTCSKTLTLLLTLFVGICGYLLVHWTPIDSQNIGHVRADAFLSYGPIDVVYTWVNGTDPRWKREKEYWHKYWIASLTGQPLPKKQDDAANVKGQDTANSDNRFRDNEELRYSLRSLEKYAPWIRNIYIVTDGQVPSWLNLEASNIKIIKHSEIFTNKSHLPVFSSPAIEWNLDNIPGLSEKFLYFNDDVFLGSKVFPEDFVSQKGVQKVYFAWEVPLCSAGCWDSWLQNGKCDAQCNTTSCDFDMGDCGCDVDPQSGKVHCDQAKIAEILESAPKPPKLQDNICSGGCHFTWIGDKGCDMSCNISSCGFDGGDCGTDQFHDHLSTSFVVENHTFVGIPLEFNSTFLELSGFFGINGSVLSATHDNSGLIRHATVFEDQMALLMVFGRDDEGDAMTSGALVTVEGKDVDGQAKRLDFELVRGKKALFEGPEAAVVMGFTTYRNTSIKPRQVRLPLGFRQAVWSLSAEEEEPVEDKAVEEPKEEEQEKRGAGGDPFLQVVLPVNVTGKHFKSGDSVALAVETMLRLHNDNGEEDFEWQDYQSCELVVPEVPKKKKVKETVAVEVDAASGEVVVGDPETLQAVASVKTEEAEAEDPSKCRLTDDGTSVVITLRLPTHSNVHAFQDHEEEEEPQKEGDHPSAVGEGVAPPAPSSASEPDSASDTVSDSDPTTPLVANRPQVSDGSICFSNADKNNDKKYCFTISMGHFQQTRVIVAMRPKPVHTKQDKIKQDKTKPVPYVAYDGQANPAWQEFTSFCMDTTRRVVGLRPRKCYHNEEPAVLEPKPVDPHFQNEQEGRKLACDAKKRRLAEKIDISANVGEISSFKTRFSSIFHELLGSTVSSVRKLMGVEMIEISQEEDLEDFEYEDVCEPLSTEPKVEISAANAEAILSKDTFGDSLKFVNRLYNRVFGKVSARRRVPSHMPFLLNRRIIKEIKSQWPNEIQETSSHRFRHPQDMQFSFAYFHYLINRHKIHKPTIWDIWEEYLDANKNGILDENEILTVASLANGDYPSDTFVNEVKTCLRPPKQEKIMEKTTSKGTVLVAETVTPHITISHLMACHNISDKLVKNVRNEKLYQLMPEDEVTFHMLSDQYKFAWNQMLGTRARRTKFVCINDDMKFPSSAVSQILHELFLSIWPKRSQFELPYHLKNRYDHIDLYKEAIDRRDMYLYLAVAIVFVLMAIFWSELKKVFGFHEIARLRAESASQLSRQFSGDDGNGDYDDGDNRDLGHLGENEKEQNEVLSLRNHQQQQQQQQQPEPQITQL